MTAVTTLVRSGLRARASWGSLLPERRERGSPWGLELDVGRFALAQLAGRGEAPRVRQVHYRRLDEASPFGEPGSLPGWIRALAEVRRAPGFGGREVVAALPGQLVDVVPLHTEAADEASFLADLSRQAAERLHYSLSEAVADYLEIGEGERTGNSRRLILVAARRPVVEFALAAIEGAGFEAVALEIGATALARLHQATTEDPAEGALVVHPGDAATGISFVQHGQVLVARVIPWGVSTLVERVEQALGLGDAETRSLLAGYRPELGEPGENPGPAEDRVGRVLAALLTPGLEDLAAETQRVWTYACAEFRTQPPRRVYLAGGAALLPAAELFLAAQLPCPVASLDPARRLAWPADSRDGGNPPPPPLLAVATGLAMRGMTCPHTN